MHFALKMRNTFLQISAFMQYFLKAPFIALLERNEKEGTYLLRLKEVEEIVSINLFVNISSILG